MPSRLVLCEWRAGEETLRGFFSPYYSILLLLRLLCLSCLLTCVASPPSTSQIPCAGGTYSSDLTRSTRCTNVCAGGYQCPPGSTGSLLQCGAPSLYCPPGSATPLTVQPGYYGVGGDQYTQYTQALCPTYVLRGHCIPLAVLPAIDVFSVLLAAPLRIMAPLCIVLVMVCCTRALPACTALWEA